MYLCILNILYDYLISISECLIQCLSVIAPPSSVFQGHKYNTARQIVLNFRRHNNQVWPDKKHHKD